MRHYLRHRLALVYRPLRRQHANGQLWYYLVHAMRGGRGGNFHVHGKPAGVRAKL
jgi:hypothetical protein